MMFTLKKQIVLVILVVGAIPVLLTASYLTLSGTMKEDQSALVFQSTIISLFLILLIAFSFARYATKPLTEMTVMLNGVLNGEFHREMNDTRIKEYYDLLKCVERMTSSLKLAVLKTGLAKEEIGIGELARVKEEAERTYKALFNSINEPIAIIDEQGRIMECNQTACETVGHDKGVLKNRRIKEFMGDKNWNRIKGKEGKFKIRFDLDGIKHGELSVKRTRYQGKKAYIVVFRDVSEYEERVKQCLTQLKEKESYLEIDDIMLVLNARGEVLFVNKAGSKMLEYEPGELKGKNWFKTCIPDKNREDLRKTFMNKKKWKKTIKGEYENPVLTKKGKVKEVKWKNSLLKNRKAENVAVVSIGAIA